MANSNVLDGMRCPKCDSEGPFAIAVECMAEVTDYGIEDTWDVEWDSESPCRCMVCDYHEYVFNFLEEYNNG
jgi:hypothetical protein